METQAITTEGQEVSQGIHPSDAAKVMYAKEGSEAKAPAPEAPKVETKVETKAAEVTQETKAVEEKGVDEKPKEEVKYELKLPEESLLAQSAVDEIVSFAKEQGLSQEAAQKLLDREHQALDNYKQTQLQQFEQMGQEWRKAVESDPVLGGDNLKATAENAKRALDRFAPDSLKKFLNESSYGNHPDLVRLFANIGQAMRDDKLVVAGTQSPATRDPVSILYDHGKKE